MILWLLPVEFLDSFQAISGQSCHASYRLTEVLLDVQKMYGNGVISTQTLISRYLHNENRTHPERCTFMDFKQIDMRMG